MAADPGAKSPIRVLPTPATRLIAICGKCGKKLGGGFGASGTRTLAKALRTTAKGARGKRAALRIIETSCLDICPKGAVALLDSQQPGAVVIVPRRTSAGMLCGRLGLAIDV